MRKSLGVGFDKGVYFRQCGLLQLSIAYFFNPGIAHDIANRQ
jgi:hypothetical protein